VFSIEFTEEAATASGVGGLARFGIIQLDMERERFLAPLSYWSVADYERQWRAAVRRIVDGQPRAALITSLADPSLADFVEWWPLYRVGQTVSVQNQLLFLDSLREPFDPADPYPHVSELRTRSEDGQAISEWRITLADLEQFLSRTVPRAR
jgi:hypothetical protein